MRSPRRSAGAALRLGFAAVFLLGLGLLDGFDLLRVTAFQWSRHDTPDASLHALRYAGTYLLGVAGLLALVLHPWRLLRRSAWVLVGLLAAVQVGFRAVNGHGFGHHEAALLWSESQFAPSALSFFLGSFALPVLLCAGVTLLLALCSERLALRRGAWALLLLPTIAAMAATAVVDRSFGKVVEMPVPIRLPVLIRWTALHRTPRYAPREEPQLVPQGPPRVDHLVLIMDESISGHWLGANGARPDTTPWLSRRPDGVLNLGVASSIANLSSSTNLLLQAGLGPADLPDTELRALRAPNLFAYLAKAGYSAELIDAQSYSERPPDMMSGFDIEALAGHVQIRAEQPELAEYEMDRATLPAIAAWIRSSPRTFTYVIKNGAHLPYADKFPPDRAWPVDPQDRRTWEHFEEPGRSYLRALEWSVDAYLRELLAVLEDTGEEVLVVYTADHGQSLDPSGRRKGTPHATEVAPPPEQAAVPLILLGVGERARSLLRPELAAALHGRISQFEVFPTLLELAGYAREDAERGRSPSLLDDAAPRGERIFVSGNVFARKGGFYVLNPGFGSTCYLNRFSPPSPLRGSPRSPDGSADTRGGRDREGSTSPTGSGTSST